MGPLSNGNKLRQRVMVSIRERLDPRTGVAPIGSLAGMADTLDCRPETLRCRIRELAEKGLIVKNEGNATSTFSTSGGTQSRWHFRKPCGMPSTLNRAPLRRIPQFPTRRDSDPRFSNTTGTETIPVSLFPRSGG